MSASLVSSRSTLRPASDPTAPQTAGQPIPIFVPTTAGSAGWSPLLAIVADGARRVFQVADWTGGAGSKPATGSYVGPSGLVATAAEAADVAVPMVVATHNSSHEHGGSDEIATATPAANAIPKALDTGKLDSSWVDVPALEFATENEILAQVDAPPPPPGFAPLVNSIEASEDTGKMFLFNAETNQWWESSGYWVPCNGKPDIGAMQGSNVQGYGADYVDGKRLSHVKLRGYSNPLGSADKDKGAIKGAQDQTTGDFEAFLWSTVTLGWRRFVTGLKLRNVFTPTEEGLYIDDFIYPYNLVTCESLRKDANGTPFIRMGKCDIGALQYNG